MAAPWARTQTGDVGTAPSGFAPFGPPRAWTRDSLAADEAALFYDLTPEALRQIEAALQSVRARGLSLETVAQEDIRLPSFATDVPEIRRRLDEGPGFIIVRGLDVADREAAGIAYWAIANYLGRVIRQNLTGARLDTVSDKGEARWDPYRVVDTDGRFEVHTDNAFLEARAPDYLGLLCLAQAKSGGHSLLVSACTLHDEILARHPEYLPRLHEDFHHDLPANQRLPDSPPTKARPIFVRQGGDLVMHYLRLYIDPGMETAGCPLTADERAMLDFVDGLMRRDDLVFQYRLKPGETLFSNNRWTLHGRTAFTDYRKAERRRLLARTWLWRRHLPPGDDPVDLDEAEFGAA